MIEAVLYLVAGISLYGGSRQLYIGSVQTTDHPHVLHGLMYLLLAGFAIGNASAVSSTELAAQVTLDKLTICLGILLWVLFTWFVTAYTRVTLYPALALLTALWALLLMVNFGSPSGLLYTEAGQFEAVSSWWLMVEMAILLTLFYALCMNLLYARDGAKENSVALSTGLVILTTTALFDFFVSAQLVQSAYLTPFGFLGFLISSNLYPVSGKVLLDQAAQSPHMQADGHPSVIQQAPMKTITREPAPSAQAIPPQIEPEKIYYPVSIVPASTEKPAPIEKPNTEIAELTRPHEGIPVAAKLELIALSDQLTDIAVHTKMIQNRCQSDDVDLQSMRALCKKVREEALLAHRLANRLSRPDK